MAEGLQLPDGTPVQAPPAGEADREFAKMMAAPAQEIPAPPKKKAEDLPEAPAKRRGRPPKNERARVQAEAPKSSPELDRARAGAVAETMNLAAGGLLMVYASTQNVAYAADAVTLSSSAETFGVTCANLAKVSPTFARIIDGSGKAGPWFAFSTACFSLGSQIAVNHKLLPAGMLGTQDPKALAAGVVQDGSPDGAAS